MSFVPEKFPENPRMAPEIYGMYGCMWIITWTILFQQFYKAYVLDCWTSQINSCALFSAGTSGRLAKFPWCMHEQAI